MNYQNFDDLINQMTPEIYENMRRAVETGKWPDGRQVTQAQRELCMQAIIVWEKKNLPEEQHTGFIQQQCESTRDDTQAVTLQAPKNKPELH